MVAHKLQLALTTFVAAATLGGIAFAEGDQLHLRGKVVDDHQIPAAGVDVSVAWRSGGRAAAVTGDDGAFDLVAPRQYVKGRIVAAKAMGGRLQAFYAIPGGEAKDGEDAITLTLSPARRFEVHVNNAAGMPVDGATVGLIGGYAFCESALTNAEGQAEFWAPNDLDHQYVFAISKRHGVDYRAYVLSRGEDGDKKAVTPRPPDGPIALTLQEPHTIRLRIVEAGGKPLAGVSVYPWLLQKPGEPDSLNLSFIVDLVQTLTNDEGVAEFAWMPAWQTKPIIFWPDSDDHIRQRAVYDPRLRNDVLTVELDRFVPIRGQVSMPDGSPAEGIQIWANGANYGIDGFRGTATTDAKGRYEIKSAPNMVYLVTVNDSKWGSAPHTGFMLSPNKAVDDIDFQLRPATKLFGRVTMGETEAPMAGQTIAVYQYGQDANNLGLDLPNPAKSSKWVQPLQVLSTKSGEDGRFELFVGDGKFDIRGPTQTETKKFEVNGESELEFNFHSDRPEKGLLRGLVVASDVGAVAGCKVMGIYRHPLAGRDLIATTDSGGKFEVERELHPVVLYTRSTDGKLAGIVEIGPDKRVAVISLRPMASATGRLVDKVTGRPVPGAEITYGTRIHIGDDAAPFRTSFGGTTKTNDEGSFTLTNIVLEVEYEVSLTIRSEDAPDQVAWRRVAQLNARQAELVDLGDISNGGDK